MPHCIPYETPGMHNLSASGAAANLKPRLCWKRAAKNMEATCEGGFLLGKIPPAVRQLRR